MHSSLYVRLPAVMAEVDTSDTSASRSLIPSPSAGNKNNRNKKISDERMQSVREAVPSWMHRQDVADWYQNSGGRSTYLLGPAIPVTRLIAVFLVVTQVVVFFTVRTFATCQGQSAVYPHWVWTEMVPLAVAHTFAEFKVLQHYAPPYIDMMLLAKRPVFTVLGFSMSFTSWFTYSRLTSTSHMLDAATDSLFAGTILQATHCPNNSLEELWTKVWQHSALGQLGLPLVSARQIVLCAWIASFLNILFPLFATFRTRSSISYNFGETGEGDNCVGDNINNESIVRQVGDAAGLTSIGKMSLKFVELKTHEAIDENIFRTGHLLRVVSLCQQVVVSRMLLSNILESALQINIQITTYALNLVNATAGSMRMANIQALMSIVLSLAMAAGKVCEALEFFRITSQVSNYKRVMNAADDPDPEFSRLVRVFRRYLWAARFLCVLYAAGLLYGFCKLAALHYCEDFVWNITGCVVLSHT